jgi:DNA-binding MarR family transcriptional regulator
MEALFNERLIPLGVTRVQWMAMYYLLKYGDMSQKELGERMDIKESTVARLLDRMESEDLIIRIQTKEDRRIKYIKLTPKGKEKIEELLPEGQKMSEFFSMGITEDEIEVFKRVLQKFEENIS